MAALQTIRSKGPLLIIVLSLALFAFIAGSYFQSLDILSNNSRQVVGEVFGDKYNYPEYQQEVDDFTQMLKFQRMLQGQNPDLTSSEQDQIRQQVWQNFRRRVAIQNEAEKAGIEVTDEDVQNALRFNTAPSVRILAQIFPSQDGTGLDVATFQKFLKEFNVNISNLQKSNKVDMIEQYNQIRKVCEYSLKQIRQEILENKFYQLMAFSAIGNKVNAEFEFNQQKENVEVQVAAIPYTSIADKEVKITDADLQQTYNRYKGLFRNPMTSVDLQILDYIVEPSQADKDSLKNEVSRQADRLRQGGDPSQIIGSSKSEVPYVNLAMSKKAFERMPDVSSVLDSLSVGGVKGPYYNAQDNTINAIKLIAKAPAADSVQYSVIVAVAKSPEASEKLADSILTAVKGGANFGQLAKKYQQTGDTAWLSGSQYEGQPLKNDDAKFFSTLNNSPVGLHIVKMNNMSFVVNIINRKNIITKYNVAIVKCPLKFSKKTYNDALNKMNKFLAENQDLKSFEKNGYFVRSVNAYSKGNLQIQNAIGGSGAKEAFKWVFDNAKSGNLSKLYECGEDNNHLVVIGVVNINEDEYLPWNNSDIKAFLTQKTLEEKKGEILAEKCKNFKSIKEVLSQKGALVEDTPGFTFSLDKPYVFNQLGVPEPKVSGAIERTPTGKFTGQIKGAAALYFVQVKDRKKGAEKFDANAGEEAIASRLLQSIFTQTYYGPREVLLEEIISKFGKEKSNLYRF